MRRWAWRKESRRHFPTDRLDCRRDPRDHSTGAVRLGRRQALGLSLAQPEEVVIARPTGAGHAFTTLRIPIEGREEWVEAAGVRSA